MINYSRGGINFVGSLFFSTVLINYSQSEFHGQGGRNTWGEGKNFCNINPPSPQTHTHPPPPSSQVIIFSFFQNNLTTEQPWRMGAGRDGLDWVQKGKGKRCQTTTKNRKSCAEDTDICFLIWRLPGTKAMICGIIFNILLASSIHLIC